MEKSENSESIKSYIMFNNVTKSLKKLSIEMWFDSENE